MDRFGGSHCTAEVIGASEAFVRQNDRETRVRGKARKSSVAATGISSAYSDFDLEKV